MDRRVFMSNIFFQSRIRSAQEKASSPKPSRSGKPRFKYFRGELLGKGSYGRVYLGLNAKTGEVMAIKQVELIAVAISARQQEIIDAHKRESEMLKGLKHENIVRYLGYEETPQHLSIFLEYVPGGTIKTCLEKYGRFREDVTKSFTSQILSGLEYLHSRAIIHRDLKADNILLEPSGICKISDFGISKQIDGLNDMRAFTGLRGTVQWMAPEIVQNKEGGYDVKVDIWSVGCIVLEMWSGELPWGSENMISVMLKLSQNNHPPVPANLRLNPLAEQFRLRCFEPNPEARPTAAELRAHRYLQLPLNWKFPYVLHDRKANRKSRTRSVMTGRRSSFTVEPDAPPVPALKPSISKNNINNTEASTPLQPLSKEAHHVDSTVTPPAENDGPPVVVITPPGSPKKRSYSLEELDASTKLSDMSARTISSRRRWPRRFFVVANPDEDSDLDSHRNFVFTPPPLPETLRRLSFRSNSSGPHLSTRPPTLVTTTTPPTSSSSSSSQSSGSSTTGNSSLSFMTSHARLQGTNSSDDSNTDEDLHLWSKPPVDLYRAPKLISASSPTLVQTSEPTLQPSDAETHTLHTHPTKATRKSKSTKARQSIRPRDSWLVRPAVQEVYDDLSNFFPGHEVENNATIQATTKKQAGEIPHPFRRMSRLLRSYSAGQSKP